jgi:hypothetical protein
MRLEAGFVRFAADTNVRNLLWIIKFYSLFVQ